MKDSPTWYHLSHCVKAPAESLPSQNSDAEGSREPDKIIHENVDGVHSPHDASGDAAIGRPEGKFDDTNFQHVPGTAELNPIGNRAAEFSGDRVATEPLRESGKQRSPRPVRRRIRPRRYED